MFFPPFHSVLLFLPLDPLSSVLIISPFPLIYHHTCHPVPPPLHPDRFLLFSQSTFSYLCSLSAVPHFSLGASSLLVESGATKHQLLSELMGWLNRRSMVQWSDWPWMSTSKQWERQGGKKTNRNTKLWRQGIHIALILESKYECERYKGRRQNKTFVFLMRAAGGKTICWWYHDGLENMSHSRPHHHPVFPLDWRVLPPAGSTIISWCPVFCSVQTTSSFR